MKYLKTKLFVLTILITAFSCEKDDDSFVTNEELIIGTWRWTSATDNGEAITLSECDLMDTIDFNDTIAIIRNFDRDVDTDPCTAEVVESINYIIEDSKLEYIRDNDNLEAEIITLNATTLTLKYTEAINSQINTYSDTYTKQ